MGFVGLSENFQREFHFPFNEWIRPLWLQKLRRANSLKSGRCFIFSLSWKEGVKYLGQERGNRRAGRPRLKPFVSSPSTTSPSTFNIISSPFSCIFRARPQSGKKSETHSLARWWGVRRPKWRVIQYTGQGGRTSILVYILEGKYTEGSGKGVYWVHMVLPGKEPWSNIHTPGLRTFFH